MAVVAERPLRQDNRRHLVLEAAAKLFARHGFHGTSMRDIAKAVGMVPASIYCHFPSKSILLLAVYEEGVARIIAGVDAAIADAGTPRVALEAACRAHLEGLLDDSAYARVVVRVLPEDAEDVADAMIALRDAYEDRFRRIIDKLALPPGTDKRQFRLRLLGALNGVQTWYRPGGALPADIATDFVASLRIARKGEGRQI